MKKSLYILTITIFSVIAAPMAHAQASAKAGPVAETIFGEMDSNGDGAVSRAEFDAFNEKRFNALDANHDGKITHEEMAAAYKKMTEKAMERFNQRFDAADTNHDGALSRAEAEKMPELSRHFDELDANKDGQLTHEEIAAAMKKMRRGLDQRKPAPDQPQ